MIKLRDLLKEAPCDESGHDWNRGHDHEASMAHNEIKDAISNASKIQSIIGDNDNLPGWVSAYITLAADYLHSVAEYMVGQADEIQRSGPGYDDMYENTKTKTMKKEMYPPYKSNMVNKVRYKASDTFTNDPKVAKKKGYLEVTEKSLKK